MRKKVCKKVLKIFSILFLSLLMYLVVSATYENIYINVSISNFMSKGVYNEELSTTLRKIYIVPRETNQEVKPAFTGSIASMRPGSEGDIIVGVDSPFPNVPVLHPLMTFFIGGHAAIKMENYDDFSMTIRDTDVVDVAGLGEDIYVSAVDVRYWMNYNYRNRFIVLIVHATEEQRKIALNEAISYVGDRYNFTFIFKRFHTHYCSDLVSKSYKAAGINLNKDIFGVTIHDLIVNENTYIFMYKYTDNNFVDHIYYIDDQE